MKINIRHFMTIILFALALSSKINKDNPSRLLEKANGYSTQDVAYIFDFFDPVMQKDIIKKFEKVYLDAISMKLDNEYLSHNNYEINQNNLHLLKDSSYKSEGTLPIRVPGEVTAPQLQSIIKEWGWTNPFPSTTNYAERILRQYDSDKNGSLNAEEFLTLSVLLNRHHRNAQRCSKHCYYSLFKSSIDPLFKLADEDGDKLLTAEELFNGMKRLSRKNMDQYNIYKCVTRNTALPKFIHTSAMNGFVLKNYESKEGFVNIDEFRTGVLMGYINRQVDKNIIYRGDEKNQKNRRWRENGTIDIECEKIMQYVKDDDLNKKVELPGIASGQLSMPSKPCSNCLKKKNYNNDIEKFKRKDDEKRKYLKVQEQGWKKDKYGKKKKKEGLIKRGVHSVKKGIKHIKKGVKRVASKVKDGVKKIGRGVKKVAKGIGKGVKKVASGVKKVAKGIGKGVKKVASGVKKVAKGIGKGVKAVAKGVGKGVKAVARGVGKVGKTVGKGVKKVGSSIKKGFKKLFGRNK